MNRSSSSSPKARIESLESLNLTSFAPWTTFDFDIPTDHEATTSARHQERQDDDTTTTSSNIKMSGIVPGPFDIILGRDKLACNHVGNKHYRRLIERNYQQYQSCASRDGTKFRITNQVITNIHECGGRFLKKNEKSGAYEHVDHKYAHDKVSHALRSAKPRKVGGRKPPTLKSRPPPTPHEDKVFRLLYHKQQEIFQELLAVQVAF